MKNINAYFFDRNTNFGDKLNELVIEELFNLKLENESPYKCDYVFIGSLLESFLHGSNDFRLLVKKIIFPKLRIWGTGFLMGENERIVRPNNSNETFFRKVEVLAVRGNLTKRRLEKITNTSLDNIALGDPGLFANRLIDKDKIEKKYKYGIIPHYGDGHLEIIKRLSKGLNNATVINPLDHPIEVLTQVAACENILSSAMHGLIVADSLQIPNVRLILSDKVTGGDYKFNDYYSAFSLDHHQKIDLRDDNLDNLENLVDSYLSKYDISFDKVKEIQDSLYHAFIER